MCVEGIWQLIFRYVKNALGLCWRKQLCSVFHMRGILFHAANTVFHGKLKKTYGECHTLNLGEGSLSGMNPPAHVMLHEERWRGKCLM